MATPRDNVFFSEGSPRGGHIPGQPGQPTRVRLTQEEIKVLRECNRESFYYRCLPYSTFAMTLTHLAVKQGYLRPNPRWGSTFKVLGAGLVGFIIGKFSYQKKCIEKIMQLPNSNLGEALRRRQKQGSKETIEVDTSEIYTSPKQEMVDDFQHDNTDRIGLDMDKNIIYDGLDDNLRPTIDSSTSHVEDTPANIDSRYTTYEELRKKNREEYEAKKRDLMSKRGPPPPAPPRGSHPPLKTPSEDAPVLKQKKGKYGDIWDD